MKVLLASGSPRRAKILNDMGISCRVVKTNAPEVSYADDPERTVRENALNKGSSVGPTDRIGYDGVLSADTIVWLDGRIYGKPKDLDEARQFLHELSGRTHTVFTGVAWNGCSRVFRSDVTFRRLDDDMIDDYVERVRPTDRAGAYDIDVSGDLLVDHWTGEYENIMGLPRAWLSLVPPRTDRRILRLNSLAVDCIIGDLANERNRTQCLTVDVALSVNAQAYDTDELADTVDYSALAASIREKLTNARCHMIERAARLVTDLCMNLDGVLGASVTVTKKNAIGGLESASATYEEGVLQ